MTVIDRHIIFLGQRLTGLEIIDRAVADRERPADELALSMLPVLSEKVPR